MDQALLAKANLGLGGVDVHIHLFGRHLQEEQHHRETGGRNHVAISLGDGVHQEPVADKPFVDKYIDRVAVELLQLRLGVEAAQAKSAGRARWLVGIFFPGRRLGQSDSGQRSLGGHG